MPSLRRIPRFRVDLSLEIRRRQHEIKRFFCGLYMATSDQPSTGNSLPTTQVASDSGYHNALHGRSLIRLIERVPWCKPYFIIRFDIRNGFERVRLDRLVFCIPFRIIRSSYSCPSRNTTAEVGKQMRRRPAIAHQVGLAHRIVLTFGSTKTQTFEPHVKLDCLLKFLHSYLTGPAISWSMSRSFVRLSGANHSSF